MSILNPTKALLLSLSAVSMTGCLSTTEVQTSVENTSSEIRTHRTNSDALHGELPVATDVISSQPASISSTDASSTNANSADTSLPNPSLANSSSERLVDSDLISDGDLPTAIRNNYVLGEPTNTLGFTTKDIQKVETWQDARGQNYLVQLKRPVDDKEANNNTNELVSHLYVVDAETNEAKRQWQVYDSVKSCGLEVTAKYAENSPIISDVNANGIAEVAISYYMGCREGDTYDRMKVVMYEGDQKFIARGNSAVCYKGSNSPIDSSGYYGGDHTIFKSLLNQSRLSLQEQALIVNQLHSVWRDTQCSTHFNDSDI